MRAWFALLLLLLMIGTIMASLTLRLKSGRTGIRRGGFLNRWPGWFLSALLLVLAVATLISLFRDPQDFEYLLTVVGVGLALFLLLFVLPVAVRNRAWKSKRNRTPTQAVSAPDQPAISTPGVADKEKLPPGRPTE